MTRQALIIALSIAFLSSKVKANAVLCQRSMSALSSVHLMTNSPTDKSAQTYLTLLRHLVKEKNAFSFKALNLMLEQKSLANPIDFASDSLGVEDRYSYSKAFASLKEVKWENIKDSVRKLANEIEDNEGTRKNAVLDTSYLFNPMPLDYKVDLPDYKFEGGFKNDQGSLYLYMGHESGGADHTDDTKNFSMYDFGKKEWVDRHQKKGLTRFSYFKNQKGFNLILKNDRAGLTIMDTQDLQRPIFISGREMFPGADSQTYKYATSQAFENAKGEMEIVSMIYVAGFEKPGATTVYFYVRNLVTGAQAIQTLPHGRYVIQKLSDDRIVAVGATASPIEAPDKSDIIVKEIGGKRSGVFIIKKPFDLGLHPRCRVVETKSGQMYLAAFDKTGNYIFDVKTKESFNLGKIFDNYPEFQAFEEQANGNLVAVAGIFKTFHTLTIDFNRKLVDVDSVSYKSHPEGAYPDQFLRLRNGELLLLQWEVDWSNKITNLHLFNLNSGLKVKLEFQQFDTARYFFTIEGPKERLISYFGTGSTAGNKKLIAMQIYGPLESDEVPK